MATIKITIKDGGLITSEISGVEGKSCDNLDAFLKSSGKIKSNQKKPEYYKKEGVNSHVRESS